MASIVHVIRWDMSKPLCHWTEKEEHIRSLNDIISCSKQSSLGVVNTPLMLIEVDHIIPDELHLMLRVTDVLTRNVILHAVELDIAAKRQHQTVHYLSTLVSCVQECGITFKVWTDDKSGSYEFTSLRGNDKKKLLRMLPTKFHQFLGTDHNEVATLWKVHSNGTWKWKFQLLIGQNDYS